MLSNKKENSQLKDEKNAINYEILIIAFTLKGSYF
jgi:hypothetical protein